MSTAGSEKKAYATPALRVEGTLAALTQAARTGSQTDATFPAHTPTGKLTFS